MPNEKKKNPDPIEDILNGGKTYTVKDVAEMLHVTDRTVFKWFNSGILSHFSISERRILVTESELKRFLAERKNLLSERRKIGPTVN